MRIRNKLYMINAAVFILFILIYTVFVFSTFDLLALKDLQRNAASVRNSILQVEYANRAVLNAPEAPVHNLQWAGDDADAKLKAFTENENLRYLSSDTVRKIEKIHLDFVRQDFPSYMEKLNALVLEIRPKIYGTSISKMLIDIRIAPEPDKELLGQMTSISEMIRQYIIWHRPLSDSYVTVTNEIIQEVQGQIRRIMGQTILTMAAGLVFSVILIFMIYRNMISRLNHVRTGIRQISTGDLSTRINISSKDEMATIGTNFNLLTETIWQKLNNIGSIIHDMGQSLDEENTGLSLEQTILNLAVENTHADSGAFYTPDHESRTVQCLFRTTGYADPFEEGSQLEEIPFGQTIIGMSVMSGDPLFLKNLDGQNLIPRKNIFDKGYISSCLILPLISNKTVRGLLCLEKNSEKSFFSDMDYENILSFIEFSAITLNNLDQYSRLIESSGLNREMEIASDIQKSLLPPRLPRVGKFDISVKTFTLKGISGDIYDFFPLGKNRWLFCMAEVEEKGIASSMLLVILRTLVRILVKADQEPAEMLNNILENFYETTGIETPLKINLCLMEPDSRSFHYCGTAHQKMLLFDRKSGMMKLLDARQAGNKRFVSVKGALRQDVFLLLMTDGFYGVRNDQGEEYGWKPPQEILKKHSDKSLDWLLDALNKDVAYFERHLEQRDDRTVFIARFKGDKS
ncbi:MAG: SpoIIE family protein phosphatase [Spirochaetales bacterium]|nr:SpoIIE family protein phosphatase [Spirochaetales bacterium]